MTEPTATKDEHWAVSVSRLGDSILTIESDCLSGRDLSAEDEACIDLCARHLLAFLGRPDTADDFKHHLRVVSEIHCVQARHVSDGELSAYRYGKAEGIREVLRLLTFDGRPMFDEATDSGVSKD